MKKIVIFNVGGALSAYGEFNEKRFVIDLGKSKDFSPVNDFLLPLFEDRNLPRSNFDSQPHKYHLDQLFLSHLDKDHISDYVVFTESFYPEYMTCPNDNEKQNQKFRINRNLIGDISELKEKVLEDMEKRRPSYPHRPLISIIENVELNYIYPIFCEESEDLKDGYANNISLTLFLRVGDKTVLFPGDLLKEGTKFLIDKNPNFKNLLENDGVDYLVAPHHGLQTSFSQKLFDTMKDKKVRLNIISEKVRKSDSNESRTDVDSRYYGEDYSTGENSLNKRGVKTSLGHIVIDFDTPETEIKQYADILDVINEFS